jgi:cytochrome b561
MKPVDSIRRAPPRSWEFALLVCLAGIAALLRDSWPNAAPVQGNNLHGAFGALLWVMAVAHFRQTAGSWGFQNETPFDQLCRRPSRMVYLVLYVVFGAQQVIRAGVLLWNRAAPAAAHPAVLQPPENLRDFLAYGIIALLTIRGLAALYSPGVRRRPDLSASQPAALQMSPGSERGGAEVELLSRQERAQNPL